MTVFERALEGYNVLLEESKSLNELVKQGKGNKEKMTHAAKVINESLNLLRPILDNESKASSYKNLSAENRQLKTKLDKLTEYMNIFSKMEEGFTNWKAEVEHAIEVNRISISDQVQQVVKENLKDIVKDAVENVTNTPQFEKTLSEAVKKSQATITKETEKCFKNNLSDALKRSQDEIVSQSTARQEADLFEKEKRLRNIVVTTIPESTHTNPEERIKEDNEFVAKITGLSSDQIEKSYRAGPPLGKGSNETRTTPRPLVVILETPDLARKMHKYGNGSRISYNSEIFWINPDLTRAERRANFHARNIRRERRATKNNVQNPTNISNVATEFSG